MSTLPDVFISGYKMTPGALSACGIRGLSLKDVADVMSETTDQQQVGNGRWLVTNGINMVTVLPYDSLIVDAARRVR